MNMMMGDDDDAAADKIVKDAIGDNPLGAQMGQDDEDAKKRCVFEQICDLTYAARDLYCDKDMPFDQVIGYLSDALLKLKGKEQELMNAEDADDNDDDNE